jgi:hypothetical protein
VPQNEAAAQESVGQSVRVFRAWQFFTEASGDYSQFLQVAMSKEASHAPITIAE